MPFTRKKQALDTVQESPFEHHRQSPSAALQDAAQVPGQGAPTVPGQNASTPQAPLGSAIGAPGMVDAFSGGSEVELFAQQRERSRGLDSRMRVLIISIVVVIVFIPLLTVLPTGVFSEGLGGVSIARIFDSLGKNIEGLVNWITGGPVTTGVSIVFWQTLAVAIVGAALSLNGCVYQAALRNPLASPSTLGVMSGGTLGTLLFVLLIAVPGGAIQIVSYSASEIQAQYESLDLLSYILVTQTRALFSLAGCIAVVLLVMLVAHIAGRGKVSKVALLLAGQVFAALITGVIAVIRTYISRFGTAEQQEALTYIVGGDVTRITGPVDLMLIAVPILIGAVLIWLIRFRLNALAFGEDEASTMGISVGAMRTFAILLCTVLTGVVISFVGAVGFVGFLVPHIARKLVGPDLTYLLPVSMFFGAAFLLLTNYIMRLTGLFMGSLGTLTSLVGAIAFLVIAIRQRARGNVDWI